MSRRSAVFGISLALALTAVLPASAHASAPSTRQATAETETVRANDWSWGKKVKVTGSSCVKARAKTSGYKDELRVRNYCKTSRKVQVVLDHAGDSYCTKVKPSREWTTNWSWPANINRVRKCG
ncbi:hypothetical protein AB0L68_30975 [Streptomyces sp. NPDC052164]|uniref:hypothetical protein n=1 Tax=Streptomyces sp. NPDC052164 TaxID=3155529 RepID=UPI00343CA843